MYMFTDYQYYKPHLWEGDHSVELWEWPDILCHACHHGYSSSKVVCFPSHFQTCKLQNSLYTLILFLPLKDVIECKWMNIFAWQNFCTKIDFSTQMIISICIFTNCYEKCNHNANSNVTYVFYLDCSQPVLWSRIRVFCLLQEFERLSPSGRQYPLSPMVPHSHLCR